VGRAADLTYQICRKEDERNNHGLIIPPEGLDHEYSACPVSCVK
jgi:hypothetical protein